jgi:hypothetical protein
MSRSPLTSDVKTRMYHMYYSLSVFESVMSRLVSFDPVLAIMTSLRTVALLPLGLDWSYVLSPLPPSWYDKNPVRMHWGVTTIPSKIPGSLFSRVSILPSSISRNTKHLHSNSTSKQKSYSIHTWQAHLLSKAL